MTSKVSIRQKVGRTADFTAEKIEITVLELRELLCLRTASPARSTLDMK